MLFTFFPVDGVLAAEMAELPRSKWPALCMRFKFMCGVCKDRTLRQGIGT